VGTHSPGHLAAAVGLVIVGAAGEDLRGGLGPTGRCATLVVRKSVVIHMRRRAPGETVRPYRHRRDNPALRTLAGHLHTWLRSALSEL